MENSEPRCINTKDSFFIWALSDNGSTFGLHPKSRSSILRGSTEPHVMSAQRESNSYTEHSASRCKLDPGWYLWFFNGSVLLGEQTASKTVVQGSNPCWPANTSSTCNRTVRSSTRKGYDSRSREIENDEVLWNRWTCGKSTCLESRQVLEIGFERSTRSDSSSRDKGPGGEPPVPMKMLAIEGLALGSSPTMERCQSGNWASLES